MLPKEKRRSKLNLLKYAFHSICFIIGIFIGVFLCNWSYFEFDSKVSVSDIVAAIVASAVALYVGNNIQRSLSKNATLHSVLNDEIKIIINCLQKFDIWTESKSYPFQECVSFFKKVTLDLNDFNEVIQSYKDYDAASFAEIYSAFIELKKLVTDISPVAGQIAITDAQEDLFNEKYRLIKKRLLLLMIS